MRVERTVEIARPPRQVFQFVADARNDPRWCPKVQSCEQVEGVGPGPGARYLARHRPTRLQPAAELRIEVVPSSRSAGSSGARRTATPSST